MLVAEHRAELLGLCTAYIDMNSVRYGARCWVEDLAVSPQHRSHGVGKELLDAAKDWARERGLQDVLIPNAWQPAVFLHLVRVNRIDNEPAEPPRLSSRTLRHSSLRQFSKGVPVSLRGSCSHLQRAFGLGIVWGQENATIGFDR